MGQIPSDSLSFSQPKGWGGDGEAAIGELVSDRVDRVKMDPWQMEGQEDIKYLETLMGAAEDEWGEIYSTSTAGKSRHLRVLIGEERPRTHVPWPTRLQLPEVEINEEFAKHPTLPVIGSRSAPS